jgi:hypothetical protein
LGFGTVNSTKSTTITKQEQHTSHFFFTTTTTTRTPLLDATSVLSIANQLKQIRSSHSVVHDVVPP